MPDKFYGVRLTDATGAIFMTEIAIEHDMTHKINVQAQETIGRKYPFHTMPSKPHYWTGTISAIFEDNCGECDKDYKFGNFIYKSDVVEFLHNGLIKTLYLNDEFIMPIVILGEVNVKGQTGRGIVDLVSTISFSYNQRGDRFNDIGDLFCYNCGKPIGVNVNYCAYCGVKVTNNHIHN